MIFNYSGAASPFDPARSAIGQHNYSPLSKLLQQQPQALQQLGIQQQSFDPSAGIGEFERRQFQPQALQQLGMQQQQEQPYQQEQPQTLQQSYQPMPQAPGMQPLLQQFRTQQRPYQSPYQNSDGGGRSGSAYSYNNSLFGQMNNLAPLNKNALNFSY